MKPQDFLNKIPHFNLICKIARNGRVNVWLVGGFLRDIFLKKNKQLRDFDFCVQKDALGLVKKFSKKTKSKFIILDEKEKSYRVILRKSRRIFTYDFTAMRGKNFLEDLSLRDFSINTLAANLCDKDIKAIDHFGAKKDLKRKIVRVIKNEVLRDDPLRILRAFSFMANYGFSIEKNTQKLMAKYKGLLKNVSSERINEELFKIISSQNSYKIFKIMDDFRILEQIIPAISQSRGVHQGSYHHLDVWQHSLETLKEFESLYKRYIVKRKELSAYLDEELAQGRSRLSIVKLACLLHDIGKPIAKKRKGKRTIFHTHEKIGRDLAENISKALRLSFREKEVLKKLIFWHLRPGYLADQAKPTRRAIYHFFRDTAEEGIAVILVSLSDWRATRGPLTDKKKRKRHERIMLKLVDKYFKDKKKKPLPKIVNGYDIMKKFNLKPGVLIGEILKRVKEEQTLGKVKTKSDAYRVAKRIVCKQMADCR
jgi:poly(A) polymerase